MKVRTAAIVMALAVLAALPLFAHGDKTHVIGVIEKVNADSVTVKTKEGKSVEVKLAQNTAYMTADNKVVKAPMLNVGQRVVIHADTKAGQLVAATVKFSEAPSAPAGALPK